MYVEDVKTFRETWILLPEMKQTFKNYPQIFEEGCAAQKGIVSTPQALTTP